MIMIIMILTSIYFMSSKHPLSMGLTLIVQSLCISMMSGLMYSFMFSYILMMIMLSGMLVLFMYMSNVASNEKFHMSNKNLLLILAVPLFFMEMDPIIWNMNNYNKQMMLKYEVAPTMGNLFMMELMPMIIMTVFYLFYTMIVVSSIVNIHEGPMRSKS